MTWCCKVELLKLLSNNSKCKYFKLSFENHDVGLEKPPPSKLRIDESLMSGSIGPRDL